MSCYFVGDIQGCFRELEKLLKKVKFNPEQDELWLAGDLVARGPNSLETLRFVKSLGKAATVVLGNHDLHLLAVSEGIHPVKERDQLHALLGAPDAKKLLRWLRKQQLVVKHPEHDVVMVHAGIYPDWSAKKALRLSQEVHQVLAGDDYLKLLKNMYGNQPSCWSGELSGYERLRFIINACTRMRYCYPDKQLEFKNKLPPGASEDELKPWFELAGKHLKGPSVVFGHWASLQGETGHPKAIGLDTGCVWGNQLTMLRWEDQKYFTQKALSKASAAF